MLHWFVSYMNQPRVCTYTLLVGPPSQLSAPPPLEVVAEDQVLHSTFPSASAVSFAKGKNVYISAPISTRPPSPRRAGSVFHVCFSTPVRQLPFSWIPYTCAHMWRLPSFWLTALSPAEARFLHLTAVWLRFWSVSCSSLGASLSVFFPPLFYKIPVSLLC